MDLWKDLSHFPSSCKVIDKTTLLKENPRCAKASNGSKVSPLSPTAVYEGICSGKWKSRNDLLRAARLCGKAQCKSRYIYFRFVITRWVLHGNAVRPRHRCETRSRSQRRRQRPWGEKKKDTRPKLNKHVTFITAFSASHCFKDQTGFSWLQKKKTSRASRVTKRTRAAQDWGRCRDKVRVSFKWHQ